MKNRNEDKKELMRKIDENWKEHEKELIRKWIDRNRR